ncbi:hypothetical protein C8R44DRAFT_908415 [Mycena epipterygia]|nr:hypothetical protein C8R44DRAFT_908415 [Mycena epipterygia]
MSTEDFTFNNEDPTHSNAGRGFRSRTSTATIAQYKEAEAKKAASRLRRNHPPAAATDAASISLAGAHTPQIPQAATAGGDAQRVPQSFTYMQPPTYPPAPDQSFFHFANPYYNAHGNSPNPFQSTNTALFPNWDYGLQNNQLLTMPESRGPTPFNPEEEDEMFNDPEADFPDASVLLAAGNADPIPSTLPASGLAAVPIPVNLQVSTPQNLRVFPQDTPSVNVVIICFTLAKAMLDVFHVCICSDPPPPYSANSPRDDCVVPIYAFPASGRPPRSGQLELHDDRQHPRELPQATSALVDKENRVHHLSSDEDEVSAPPKKKSRQDHATRSITNVAPDRIPVIEAGFTLVQIKTMTDDRVTWLNKRADLAVLSEDAFNYGLDVLKLDGRKFDTVQPFEQDLSRERIYGTRADFKLVARDVVKGPNGYDFRTCGSKATKQQQEAVATHNRAEVALLTEKSAFVFEDPRDRKAKGTLYQHASIEATIQGVVFDGLLSHGIQHPELFDDTLPKEHHPDDETQPPHKPTFSLVAANLAINAIRATIMEYASGHFVPETYSRKIYKPLFDAELKTLRKWLTYTSNPTKIEGDGPIRYAPASFLARTWQENIFTNARLRHLVLKDVVAPIPSTAVMNGSDFAVNHTTLHANTFSVPFSATVLSVLGSEKILMMKARQYSHVVDAESSSLSKVLPHHHKHLFFPHPPIPVFFLATLGLLGSRSSQTLVALASGFGRARVPSPSDPGFPAA